MKPTLKENLKNKIVELAGVAMMLMMGALPVAHAQDHVGGGGGGDLEIRVDHIRADILSWIEAGGADLLNFKNSCTDLATYKTEMEKILAHHAVIISFTDELVLVDGKEKACRGYKKEGKAYLDCNISRFKRESERGQYRLVHHEYAGLAVLEFNEGASSDYALSDQITKDLSRVTILKLVVGSGNRNGIANLKNPNYAWNEKMLRTLKGVCADTWCEGHYYFDFYKFNCNFKEEVTFGKRGMCSVDFSMHRYGEITDLDNIAGSCVLMNYPTKASVSKPGKMLYDSGLSNRFYEELSNCIRAWEVRADGRL